MGQADVVRRDIVSVRGLACGSGGQLELCRQIQFALLLSESDVAFVVVGGTARLLRGASGRPRDLDLVVRPADLAGLSAALVRCGGFSVRLREGLASPQRVRTAWSEVDVFVQDALPAFIDVVVDGVRVQVADD